MNKKENLWGRLGPRLPRSYLRITTAFIMALYLTTPALAATDLWTAAQTIIVDIYSHIATLSTALAGLMSAIAVLGAKLSNNQHKVDQAWDWLKRIWICWGIINGIGAFIAYITPHFSGLATITP